MKSQENEEDKSYQEKVNFELSMFTDKSISINEIIDNIFIGNYASALSKETLIENNIKNIVVAGKDMEFIFNNDNIYKFNYLVVPLYDSEYTNITVHFKKVNDFIQEKYKKQEKVLVHCGSGISRSVALVIAYLIEHHNLNYEEAFKLVKSKRSVANPNIGFRKQLLEFSSSKNSVLNKNK